MAQRRDEAAEESLNRERKTNTRRRIRMALSAAEDAYEEKRIAEILTAIAQALDEGKLEFLARIRYASQVMELEGLLREANYQALHTQYEGHIPYEVYQNSVPNLADIRHVRWPTPLIHKSTLYDLADAFDGKKG